MPTESGKEVADSFFQRLRYIDDLARTSYAEVGRILIEVEKHKLHEHLIDPDTKHPCSFTRFVQLAAPYSYAHCFEAKRVMEALADVPAADLAQIPPANLRIMEKLSTATRNDPGVLAAAKSSRSDAFVEYVKKEHPSQHIESTTRKTFVLTETQAAEVEEAIALAMKEGAVNRNEALAAIAIDYRASLMIHEVLQ